MLGGFTIQGCLTTQCKLCRVRMGMRDVTILDELYDYIKIVHFLKSLGEA